MPIEINIEQDIFLPCYHHLLEPNDIDIEFIWGGRDSGKSHFCAQKLILDCLQLPFFRCILIKKTHESIKDSQWQTIKDIVEEWGLESYFHFKTSPLEIECINGNKFIARGCDNPTKLKSIRNPSHAWYEEGDQITLEDFTTISTTLRSNYGKVRQYFLFNPELPKGITDKKDFWLYKNYFSHTNEKNFIREIVVNVSGKDRTIKYRSTHTTYKDNLENVTDDRIVTHEDLKTKNPNKYLPYTLGEWGTYSNDNPFFYSYNHDKHFVFESYNLNTDLGIDIGFDFNANPTSAVIGQRDLKNLTWNIIDVIIADEANSLNVSPLAAVCIKIREKYGKIIPSYKITVTGDASGKSGSADRQKAQTFYYTIMQYLKLKENQVIIRGANPTHVYSSEMINNVLHALPKGAFNLYNVPELEKDILASFPDKDKSLNEAKSKFGLHILDAWRYLMDYWFGIINNQWCKNNVDTERVINAIILRLKNKNGA